MAKKLFDTDTLSYYFKGIADILIASIAFANNLILVTNNTAHFKRINGLMFENGTDK